MHAVLQDLDFVGFFGQRVGANTDFALACCAHFVVVYFNNQAHGFHGCAHSAPQVVQAVNRRYREVAAFHARAVANIVFIKVVAGNPCSFF